MWTAQQMIFFTGFVLIWMWTAQLIRPLTVFDSLYSDRSISSVISRKLYRTCIYKVPRCSEPYIVHKCKLVKSCMTNSTYRQNVYVKKKWDAHVHCRNLHSNYKPLGCQILYCTILLTNSYRVSYCLSAISFLYKTDLKIT